MAAGKRSETTALVLGAGFGGIACAKRLSKKGVHVTLVDRHDYTQFQPLLYQVATAQVNVTDVARPIRQVFHKREGVVVRVADIAHIDPPTKTATSADGISFSADYLVLAMGSQPNFFNTPGAEAHAFPLYSLEHAERLRSRMLGVLEDALRNPKLIDQGALNFVVVGAGATGVETAGAIADSLNRVIPHRIHAPRAVEGRIHLIDPAPVVLAPFSDRAHTYAQQALEKMGVTLELGVKVTEITPDRVVLSDGREILTRVVVWAGGIQASEAAASSGIQQGHGGRFDVAADLSVPAFPGVYAVGDVANTPGPDGKPFPQLGSVALQAGRWAAENILADIEGKPRSDFQYKDKGIMAMIGRNAAIAEVGPKRRELHGVLAFVSWLGVHAWLLSGFRERIDALGAWGWDYVANTRASAIIDRPDAARIDWD
jgi:NADH:quinone reductase (non-electrogenic)